MKKNWIPSQSTSQALLSSAYDWSHVVQLSLVGCALLWPSVIGYSLGEGGGAWTITGWLTAISQWISQSQVDNITPTNHKPQLCLPGRWSEEIKKYFVCKCHRPFLLLVGTGHVTRKWRTFAMEMSSFLKPFLGHSKYNNCCLATTYYIQLQNINTSLRFLLFVHIVKI